MEYFVYYRGSLNKEHWKKFLTLTQAKKFAKELKANVYLLALEIVKGSTVVSRYI